MKKLKEIDITKAIPACVVLSAALSYLITSHARGSHLAEIAGVAVGPAVAVGLGMLIRLGRLPWFEMKDGKKHRFILWLERKIVFLRADFYRK
jgi:hypothetical protein